MAVDNPKRKSKNLRQRRETMLKRIYELGKYYGVDVALIVRQNGWFFTCRSIDRKISATVYGGDCKTMPS